MSMIYEVTDLESNQCAKGTSAALSVLTGVNQSLISKLACENKTYKKRYKFQILEQEEVKKKSLFGLEEQYKEICEIFAEVKVGKRRIQKAADGKRYAVKVKESER